MGNLHILQEQIHIFFEVFFLKYGVKKIKKRSEQQVVIVLSRFMCFQGSSACSNEYLPSVSYTSSSSIYTIKTGSPRASHTFYRFSSSISHRNGRYFRKENELNSIEKLFSDQIAAQEIIF